MTAPGSELEWLEGLAIVVERCESSKHVRDPDRDDDALILARALLALLPAVERYRNHPGSAGVLAREAIAAVNALRPGKGGVE
jgi:hypothetical protein